MNNRQSRAQLVEEVVRLRQQLADFTHAINDPLGVILGYTDMLLQEASNQSLPSQWPDRLEQIKSKALVVHAVVHIAQNRVQDIEE